MPELILGFCLVMGGVSAGESGLLLVGMRSGDEPSVWMTPSNIAYAVSDIVLGIGLSVTALVIGEDKRGLLIPLVLLSLTNAMRMVEYFSGAGVVFCANQALLVVDIAKLVVGIAAGGLVIAHSFRVPDLPGGL